MQTSKEETWVRVVEAYLDFISMKQSELLKETRPSNVLASFVTAPLRIYQQRAIICS